MLLLLPLQKIPVKSPKFIVVIGTSAGGIAALTELVSQLKPQMDAAFSLLCIYPIYKNITIGQAKVLV